MNPPSDPIQPPAPPFRQQYSTPPPPASYAYQQPKADGLAVAGMVVGIVGLFLGFLWVVLPVLAVVFSAVGLYRINGSNGWRTGKGMAIAGLTTGIVGAAFWGLMFLLVLSGRS
jgi:Domain of unknown function (DUF4190)